MQDINITKLTEIIDEHKELIALLEKYMNVSTDDCAGNRVILQDYYVDVLRDNLKELQDMLNKKSNGNNIDYTQLFSINAELQRLKKEIYNDQDFQEDETFKSIFCNMNNTEKERDI